MAKRIEKWLDARGELHDTQQMLTRVGERIRELRITRGLTVTDLAECSGLSRPSMSRVEAGKQALSLQSLFRVARELNVAPGTLLDPPENPGGYVWEIGTIDPLAWHGVELLAILKRHLEPEQQKRFDPVEAPIDEAKAERALFDVLLGEGVYAMAEEDATITQVMKHRREVVMILQGIERPEPISEEKAKAMLKAERFANGCDWMDGIIVERRAEVMAILERVR